MQCSNPECESRQKQQETERRQSGPHGTAHDGRATMGSLLGAKLQEYKSFICLEEYGCLFLFNICVSPKKSYLKGVIPQKVQEAVGKTTLLSVLL